MYLRGSHELIAARIAARKDHYFKPGMLDSQFAALEEPSADEGAITLDVSAESDQLVNEIIAATGVES